MDSTPVAGHEVLNGKVLYRIRQTHLWTYATDLHQDWPWSGLKTQLHYFRTKSRRLNDRGKYVPDKRK